MVEIPDEAVADTEADSLDATFSALAHSGRRRLVRHLLASPSETVPVAELATVMAAHEREAPLADVTDDERRDAALEVRHKHLPSLDAAALIERDDEAESVRLAEHPALEDPGVVEAVGGDSAATAASLDELFRTLADSRRRTVLGVLSHQFGAIHVETLARELEAADRDAAESEVPAPAVERTSVRLRHADLPLLAEAGLVDHDPEAGTVEYLGHPALRVPWIHSVFQPAFRGSLTGEAEPDGIGEIEGCEEVVSFGQSLCERAEEELFCIITETDLVRAGCLARIRNAACERDVDVYLGTRDPAVRKYVRENAPEVVVWEPNTDWLNIPAAGNRVGRLLLVDREAVMLGTLAGDGDEESPGEQAIVGEDAHDTLVTMVRQLVSPHLEVVDSETTDLEAHIPLRGSS